MDCDVNGCDQFATYYRPYAPPTRCAAHRTPDLLQFAYCREVGCKIPATYGPPESIRLQSCKLHSDPGWLNRASSRCREPGCTKSASYGPAGSTRRTGCVEHRQAGWVRNSNSTCTEPGCSVRARFGPGPVRLHCKTHRTTHDTRRFDAHKLCEDCSRRPSYKLVSNPKIKYCSLHRTGDCVSALTWYKPRTPDDRSSLRKLVGGGTYLIDPDDLVTEFNPDTLE